MTPLRYRDQLLERLKDPAEAATYLSVCLDDSHAGFLAALRDVVDANGGMAQLAIATGLSRETLYRTLSETGNPRLWTLGLIIEALNLRLSVEQI